MENKTTNIGRIDLLFISFVNITTSTGTMTSYQVLFFITFDFRVIDLLIKISLRPPVLILSLFLFLQRGKLLIIINDQYGLFFVRLFCSVFTVVIIHNVNLNSLCYFVWWDDMKQLRS